MKSIFSSLFLLFCFFASAQNISTECLAGKKLKIVVIGSSTAAGAGASTSDSAWVNRYRKHLKDFNLENEVINLAQGGYNTYKLMPHEFIPPTGRPTVDSTKNITAALAEDPNAIIINLPSNDASSGFSAAEQLSNFDSIVRVSNSAGVPIWVCTTQPKNFNNTNLVQVQMEVRDSIFARYGDQSLDFWNGLANPAGGLDSLYNSGDGTHLNDAGHGLLFERVRNRMILLDLTIDPDIWDYRVIKFEPIEKEIFCEGEDVLMELVYTNFGKDQINDLLISVIHGIDSTFFEQFSVPPPPTCENDTITFIAQNDTLIWLSNPRLMGPGLELGRYEINRLPSPQFAPYPEAICENETAFFDFDFQNTDTVFWYDQPTGGNIIANGKTFQTGTIDQDTTFWAEAINGDLFYKKNLFTTDEFNRDWNGMMFDITVNEDAIIDSLHVNMFSIGEQVFEIYKKDGSLIGSESDSAAWVLYKTDTVQVDFNGDFVLIPDLNLSLSANDTIGLYLKMQNPVSDMNYLATSFNETVSDTVLSITNGTGITHGFMQTYFPRLFSGEIFYHHGDRPQGECSTGRVPVDVIISKPELNLPREVVIDKPGDLTILDAGPGFTSYLWSTGETTQSISILGEFVFNNEIQDVYLTVTDSIGCMVMDTVIFHINVSDISEQKNKELALFPNPGYGYYSISGKSAFAKIEILNPAGQRIFSVKEQLPNDFDWTFLDSGFYFVKILTDNGMQLIRLSHLK